MSWRDCECFCSLDWGFNAPGCCLWWICLVDGHYHVAQEYKFQRMTVSEVGLEIVKRTKDLGVKRLRYVVADPACWQHTGAGKGEAIAETLARRPISLPMKKGDNDRKNGWQRCHELFQPAPDGLPWVSVDPSCRYLIRTIPAAVSVPDDPDDLDTKGDDHALDAFRYGAMSRPAPTRIVLERGCPKGSAGAMLREALAAASEAA